ncbi:hypothetical protein GFS24_10250 [Chitinophaga sp. SYP-B3965]|uniref:hypothetical protein n=1 Tax=Chitinophaga sp. SYP-B3965 TaxID=2663120 RepID=UPI001299A483|nr:hypothetical protein [Chitinophaga sp. SYP-B3965]MRG45498.1 hypothetical protein [Chitinophaga sp. SYP-B3965]
MRKTLEVRKIIDVVISSSWRELTSRAEFTLPRNISFFDRYKIKEVFRIGDPVIIQLGYDSQLYEEFSGYVVSVSADIPITIRCEDEMWRLKQIPVNYSSSAAILQTMLSQICPGYSIDALEGVSLGGVRFAKTTVAKVLEKLQQDFNLYSYMKGKQLVCGKYYADDTTAPAVSFHLERNLVSNDLNYRSKEDIILKVKGTSMLSNGGKIEFELGDDGGDNLNLSYYNITIRAELERLVRDDYEKRKRDGFDGTITAFGVPRVQHGMKANLQSFIYPDRNGTYYIDAVEKHFDEQGYRQQITLGGKVT